MGLLTAVRDEAAIAVCIAKGHFSNAAPTAKRFFAGRRPMFRRRWVWHFCMKAEAARANIQARWRTFDRFFAWRGIYAFRQDPIRNVLNEKSPAGNGLNRAAIAHWYGSDTQIFAG